MTGFRYAVLRLTPDPVRQEFMNVGVVVAPATGPAVIRVVHGEHLKRAQALGFEGDFDVLKAVARDIKSWKSDCVDRLREASLDWGGTVRVSDLRGALHTDAVSLCDELFVRHVTPVVTSGRSHVRDRRDARRVVRDGLRAVLPSEAVKRTPTVSGKVEAHQFDAGVQNGKLLHAVAALSFDIKTDRLLASDIDASAWAISDVKESLPNLPISVVTIGGSQRKLLARARSVYSSLGVDVIPERDVPDWAKDVQVAVKDQLKAKTIPGTI